MPEIVVVIDARAIVAVTDGLVSAAAIDGLAIVDVIGALAFVAVTDELAIDAANGVGVAVVELVGVESVVDAAAGGLQMTLDETRWNSTPRPPQLQPR